VRALEYFAPDPAQIPHEISAYLAERQRTGAAPSTIYAYQRDLLDFATFLEETTGQPFATRLVTTAAVVEYKSYLRIRRLAARTINRRLAAIKGLCRYAVAMGWITSDPTATVAPARLTPAPPRSLSPAQQEQLICTVQIAGHARNIAMTSMMLHGGLRVGEITALRISDLDLEPGHERILVRAGKGDRDRVVPLNAVVREALAAWLAVRPMAADDHLFLGQRGQALAANTIQQMMRAYGERAGIGRLTPHMLRHSFARGLVAAGVDLPTVARLLGHSSVATTQVYTQPSEEEMRAAVQRLAGRMP
jgi:site-specific recombinase XerD